MSGRQIHRAGTMALSVLMVAIGVALTVQALTGASVVSGRLLLGLLFLAAGAGRLYLEHKRGRGSER
jgi:hypothetical protein